MLGSIASRLLALALLPCVIGQEECEAPVSLLQAKLGPVASILASGDRGPRNQSMNKSTNQSTDAEVGSSGDTAGGSPMSPQTLLSVGIVLAVAVTGVMGARAQDEDKDAAEPFDIMWYHWLLLYGGTLVTLTCQDMYIPNMPQIMLDLQTTPELLQLTLQATVLIGAVSSVIVGRISDLFGRRNSLIIVMSFLLLGALLAANSFKVGMLIAGRVAQAIAETATAVVTQAIVLDNFPDQKDRACIFACFGAVGCAAVTAAPFLGGAVGSYLGWRAIFWLQAGAALVLLVGIYVLIPRSLDHRLMALQSEQEDKICWATLRKHGLSVAVLLLMKTLMSSQILCVLSTFPYILQQTLGMSEMGCASALGALAIASSLGVVLFAMTEHLDLALRARAALVLLFLAGLGFAGLSLSSWQQDLRRGKLLAGRADGAVLE